MLLQYQAIAAWTYGTADLDGVITLSSRHCDDLQLWASSNARRPVRQPQLRHTKVGGFHHKSDAIRGAFQVLGLAYQSE